MTGLTLILEIGLIAFFYNEYICLPENKKSKSGGFAFFIFLKRNLVFNIMPN
jgi:hypothetical protein